MNSLANFYIVNVSDEVVPATEKESNLLLIDERLINDKLVLPYQKEALKIFINNQKN